jgi:SAM-dependent methyltransferase
MYRWNNQLSSNYQKVDILKKSGVYQCIVKRLLSLRDGIEGVQRVLDLGCGSGYISALLPNCAFTNVDPYPPKKCHGVVIESGVREYLDGIYMEYDIVLCLFSLHHFYYNGWLEDVEKVLVKGGVCMIYTIDKDSGWFGDDEFNRVFFSRGFESHPIELVNRIERETMDVYGSINRGEMVEWLRSRSWSHLNMMSNDEIEFMVGLVPQGEFTIHLRVEVYIFQL